MEQSSFKGGVGPALNSSKGVSGILLSYAARRPPQAGQRALPARKAHQYGPKISLQAGCGREQGDVLRVLFKRDIAGL